MEQKEIVHRYCILSTSTSNKVLKVLPSLSSDSISALKDKLLPLEGKNSLYKLMSYEDPLASVQLHEKVNLNKLKGQLEAQGPPFAFKETKEGTNLYFRIKDTELTKKVLEHVLTNTKKNPQMTLRRPNTIAFDERLAYTAAGKEHVGKIN